MKLLLDYNKVKLLPIRITEQLMGYKAYFSGLLDEFSLVFDDRTENEEISYSNLS